MTISVFIVDDHELIRAGLRGFIEAEEDMVVAGEAATAGEALAFVRDAAPDVAILDVRLPDRDGVEVCREIRSRQPSVRCLFLTSFGDEDGLFDAIMAGAAGYLLKTTRAEELVSAIRTVAGGNSLIDPSLTSSVLARLRPAERGGGGTPLTPQEDRILGLIAEGLTNRQIAERMFLAEKTVKNYVSRLLAKLGVDHRTQAALYAVKHRRARDSG